MKFGVVAWDFQGSRRRFARHASKYSRLEQGYQADSVRESGNLHQFQHLRIHLRVERQSSENMEMTGPILMVEAVLWVTTRNIGVSKGRSRKSTRSYLFIFGLNKNNTDIICRLRFIISFWKFIDRKLHVTIYDLTREPVQRLGP
jgi:hypothetical protein